MRPVYKHVAFVCLAATASALLAQQPVVIAMRGGLLGRRRLLRRWKNISKAMAAMGFRAGGPFGGNVGNFTEGDGAVCWIGREIEPVDSVCPHRPLLALVTLAFAWPVLHARECGLAILVLDKTGKVLPYRVESFKSEAGTEEAGRFKGQRVEALPCGRYTYELLRSDTTPLIAANYGGRAVGPVLLEDEHQVLTLASDPQLTITPVGVIFNDSTWPPEFSLHGTVSGAPKEGVAWIRLLAVASNTIREVALNSDGRFEFYHPDPGEYILLVLQPGRLLAARHIVVSPAASPSIEVNLAASAP